MSLVDISILFDDDIRPVKSGARGLISNGEFLAVCLLSLGPTTMRDFKTLLGQWRTLDGPYSGNEGYFRPSPNRSAGHIGPGGIKWCGHVGDPKCYWWLFPKDEETVGFANAPGKHTKRTNYLVLSEHGLRLALKGLEKVKKFLSTKAGPECPAHPV